MGTDALGDRMKAYERQETEQRFSPLLPIYARLDGRGFSRFTKGFERPYDARFRQLMRQTTEWMVDQTNARVGYTQSDEISLCFLSDSYESPVFFEGKKQKMLSILSAMATQRFNRLLWTSEDPFLRAAAERDPVFDARANAFPNKEECAQAFLWREKDATKNALSMAARTLYSHKELMGKNSAQLNELLYQKGVNFNDYPPEFKRGVYVQRRRVLLPLSQEQLAKIPPNQRPTDGMVERSQMVSLDLPQLSRLANPVDVLFEGVEPIVRSQALAADERPSLRQRRRP